MIFITMRNKRNQKKNRSRIEYIFYVSVLAACLFGVSEPNRVPAGQKSDYFCEDLLVLLVCGKFC
jgi:hypothetical protein